MKFKGRLTKVTFCPNLLNLVFQNIDLYCAFKLTFKLTLNDGVTNGCKISLFMGYLLSKFDDNNFPRGADIKNHFYEELLSQIIFIRSTSFSPKSQKIVRKEEDRRKQVIIMGRFAL